MSSLLSSHGSSTEQEHDANHEPTLDAEAMIFSEPMRPSTSPLATGGLGAKAQAGIRSQGLPPQSYKGRRSKRRNTLQAISVPWPHEYAASQSMFSASRSFTASPAPQKQSSFLKTKTLNEVQELDESRSSSRVTRRESSSRAQLSVSSTRSSVVTQIHVPIRTRSTSPMAVRGKSQDRPVTARLSLDVPRTSIRRKEHSPPSTSSTASRSIFSHRATPGTSLSSNSRSVRKGKPAAPVLQEELYFGSSEGSDADSELSSVSSLSDISGIESSVDENHEFSEAEEDGLDFSPRLSTSPSRQSSPTHRVRRVRSYSPPSSTRGYSSDDACPPPIARVRLERPLQQNSVSPEPRKKTFKQRTLLLTPHVTSPDQASAPSVQENTTSKPKSLRSSRPSVRSASLSQASAPAVQKSCLSNQRWTPPILRNEIKHSAVDGSVQPLRANSNVNPPSVNSGFNPARQKSKTGGLSLRKSRFLSRFSLAASPTPRALRSTSTSHSNRRPAASRHLNAAQELTLSTLAQHALLIVDQPPTPPPKDTPPPTSNLPRPFTPDEQVVPEQAADTISPVEGQNQPKSLPSNRRLTLQEAVDSVSPPRSVTQPCQHATASTPIQRSRSLTLPSVSEAPAVPRVSYPRTSVPNRSKTKRKMSIDIKADAVSPPPPSPAIGVITTISGQTTSPVKEKKWLQPVGNWRLRIGKGVNRKERRDAQRLEEMCRRDFVGV